KKLQQYIQEKGLNVDVTGQLDKATFQALHMIGINDLMENGVIQEDSYRGNPSDPLSLNLYTYCHNNPVVYIDPSGHKHIVSDFTYTYTERKFVTIDLSDSSTWLTDGWSLDNESPRALSYSDGKRYILGEAVKKFTTTLKKHEFTNLNMVLYGTSDGSGYSTYKTGAFNNEKKGFIEAGTNEVIATIEGMNELDNRHKWDKVGDWANAGISVASDIVAVLKFAKAAKAAKSGSDIWKATRGFATPNKIAIGSQTFVDGGTGEFDDGGYFGSWLTGLIPIYGSYSAIVEAISDDPLRGVFVDQ
ncbi:MAG: hypothetical protein N4A55_05795, partial [Vallitalea sp.]